MLITLDRRIEMKKREIGAKELQWGLLQEGRRAALPLIGEDSVVLADVLVG